MTRFLRANVRAVYDLRLMLEVIQATLLTWVLLHSAPLSSAMRIGSRNGRRLSARDVAKVAGFTDVLVRRLARRNPCINRAVSLYRLLRRHGLPVTFHAGLHRSLVCSTTGKLRGHAWLSLDGCPYLECDATLLSEFHETFRYPGA